jgi:hypothetical protein
MQDPNWQLRGNDRSLGRTLRSLPRRNIFPQNVESVQSILDGLIFFGRPAVVHREFLQPHPNPFLRYLDFLVYCRPVSFEQCGRVELVPTILGLDIYVTSRIPNEL